MSTMASVLLCVVLLAVAVSAVLLRACVMVVVAAGSVVVPGCWCAASGAAAGRHVRLTTEVLGLIKHLDVTTIVLQIPASSPHMSRPHNIIQRASQHARRR